MRILDYIRDQYIVGDIVSALSDIVEPGFEKHVDGASEADAPWQHAAKGQRGIVIYVNPEDFIPCVRFFDSGTATDCGFDQIEFVMRCDSIANGRFSGMGMEQYPKEKIFIKTHDSGELMK